MRSSASSSRQVSALSPTERKNAERRMRENAAIAALTREKLTQREASYRYALERLVIQTGVRVVADGTQKRRATHARKRGHCRFDTRKTDAAGSVVSLCARAPRHPDRCPRCRRRNAKTPSDACAKTRPLPL